MDAGQAEAYADRAAVDREEQPEELPQEAHAYGTSQAKSALGARCPKRFLIGNASVYYRWSELTRSSQVLRQSTIAAKVTTTLHHHFAFAETYASTYAIFSSTARLICLMKSM